MEELILLYYLRIISLIISFFIIFFSYYFFTKELNIKNNNITIIKNENIKSIVNENFKNLSFIEINFLELYLSIYSKFFKNIHYGKFVLPSKLNIRKFTNIITQPSNFIFKITIVEGWSKSQLNNLLNLNFKKVKDIEFTEILADTYYLHSYENFDIFYSKLKIKKKEFMDKYTSHELLKSFTFDELLIIGSLLEREGIDEYDKKLIFSVIKNRLDRKMKLQIDATTIYSLTDGKNDLKRKLNFNDLKVKHPFNTYFIHGLPPGPISYVGKKTMELIFENHKSKYLYYFYNNVVKQHIYSETFEDHKRKLSEYRN